MSPAPAETAGRSGIRVLVVEDSPADARFMVRRLENEGYEVEWRRVETADALAAALDEGAWDVVLSDYDLAAFSAEGALSLIRARELDLPFLVVTGAVGEASAAAVMREGAHDFLVKDDLARLAPAVERELREAGIRRERRQALQELEEAEHRYRTLFQQSRDGFFVVTTDGVVMESNPALLRMFRTTEDELERGLVAAGFYQDPDERQRFLSALEERGYVEGMELRMQRADGTPLRALVSATLWTDESGRVLGHQGMITDVTELTRTREELEEREAALRERVKELRCLYDANELLRGRDVEDPSTWRDFLALIPVGWQHPEHTEARLRIGGSEFATSGWTASPWTLSAAVDDDGDGGTPGTLEVAYTGDRPEGTGEPFLAEERELLEALALRVGESLRRHRAEEGLRRREALFRTVAENSPDVILILDQELDVVFRSSGGPETSLGYESSLMEGVGAFERVHPDDRERVRRALTSMVEEGRRTAHTSYRIIHPKDDEIRHVEGAAVNLTGDPAVRGVVVNVRDVTDRRRAEARIRFQADLLNAVGQAIVATDLEGRITYWGGGAEEVYGWSAQEVLGRSVLEVTTARGMEDEASRILEKLRAGESWAGEFRVERKDGTRFPAIISDHPLKDEDGELVGIVGVTTDISELKEAEASLRESEERFRALIEHSEDLIAILAPDGTIRYESPAVGRILGVGGEERVGAHSLEESLMHPDDQEAAERILAEVAAREGASRRIRFRVRDARGEFHTIEGTLTNLTHLDAVGGIVMNGRDVTERDELERRLYQAQRIEAVGRLAGGIAHDFNNIMTSIQGFTRMVLEELDAGDPRRDDLEEVLREAGRAADLTGQLLAFSRRQMLVPRVLDLRTSIREMERMLARLIGEDVELSVGLSDEPLLVRVDPGQLEQVVVNLAVNARDAMSAGGSLRIAARGRTLGDDDADGWEVERGAFVELVVEDTGRGMSAEILEHAFEPFFTTKPSGEGTGLGLATVYGIVKQSGGEIRAESEPGEGARFTILLPREDREEVEEDAGGEKAAVREKPGLRAPGDETVLVAEDDPAVGDLIQRILKRHGYRVRLVRDGEAAAALLDEDERPDLLVTDMVMPGMGGGELAERARERHPDLPVVFMTGYTREEIQRRGFSEARGRFVSKPFDAEGLLRAVRGALGDD